MRLAALAVVLVAASPAPAPECSWSPVVDGRSTLSASGLPTNDTFAVTFELYPVGTTMTTPDGTWSGMFAVTGPVTAYFWQRGGGKSLLEVPRQVKDYKVIAYCSVG